MQKKKQRLTSLLYHLATPLLLACVTIITYIPSLHYNFQFDDIANIQKNFFIRHHNLWNLFFSGSRWISYWLNSLHYHINKFDPFSYRLANLIIHTINGLLVFYFVRFVLKKSKEPQFFKNNSYYIATTTALLFLLHPVQTQTVSYVIQGQLEGLACLSILTICITFLHLCFARDTFKKVALFGALMLCAALSCGTKEIAIISPILLLLVDWFFVAQGSVQAIKKRWWLHAGVTTIIVGIYLWFLKPTFFTQIFSLSMEAKNNIGNVITNNPKETIKTWPFFISQFKVILHYMWMFLWPRISVEYDWMLVSSFFSIDCIVPLFLLMLIGYGILKTLRTNRTHPLCFGMLWFFISIAPRSSIIPSPELLVDYKTYTASIGWLMVLATACVIMFKHLAYAIEKYSTRATRRTIRTVCTLFLALPLSFMTWQRNKIWRSGKEFWMSIIQNAPGKARAYNNYAVELSQGEGKYEQAIPYFKKATQMDKAYPDPWNNLAVCYSQLQKIDLAIQALQEGLKISPYYPEGYNNLASFYLRTKKYDKAEKCLRTALQLRPHYGKAYFNLGRLYSEKQEPKKALTCFKKACTIADLDNEFGYKTYANAALMQHNYQEAIWGYNKVLELNPQDLSVMFNLANTYYLYKDFKQSTKLYTYLLQATPDDIRVWYNLGESYLMQEQYTKAFECFKRVEPRWKTIPQVRVRLANCHEKLGNPSKACQELQRFIQEFHEGSSIRSKAQEMLAQLQEHYGPHIAQVAIS